MVIIGIYLHIYLLVASQLAFYFSVKIHDLSNLQETSSVLNLSQESGLERISWSTDGQLLAVITRGGSVNVYVSHMQLLSAVCPPRIAILSSLTEISLYSYSADKVSVFSVKLLFVIQIFVMANILFSLINCFNSNVFGFLKTQK